VTLDLSWALAKSSYSLTETVALQALASAEVAAAAEEAASLAIPAAVTAVEAEKEIVPDSEKEDNSSAATGGRQQVMDVCYCRY